MKRVHQALAAIGLLLAAIGVRAAIGFPATHHEQVSSSLGRPSSGRELEALADRAGPLSVETVNACDWGVPRSGVLNLEHPRARAAGLTEGEVPIAVTFHAVRHPQHGLYLIDTGLERALRDDPAHAAVRGFMASVLHWERIRFKTVTAEWLEASKVMPAGVFLTHFHMDHISGMRDIPDRTPVYLNAAEVSSWSTMNWFTQAIADDALRGKPPVRTWTFVRDPDDVFAGVIDVFGDGTLFAIEVPGHTKGSTAYLARTTTGSVLMTGDTSSIDWGWQNGVEPGYFSEDRTQNADSLGRLKRFVERHPRVEVRLGHEAAPVPRSVAAR